MAATLRLCDVFGGILVADEFCQRANSELAQEIARILNQGFQRNRPLIKCTGDDNQPTAFSCFGPKLFALRTSLGDNATETRTIFIQMKQRTRKDIPISLPRAEFDRRALALRNRLLAWRFAILGRIKVDPTLADPRLEDRGNQIGLPLLSIAGPKTRETIVAALVEQQAALAADRADSLAGEILEVVFAIAELNDVGWHAVRPKDVAREFNR